MLLNWLKIYRYLLPVRACVRGHYQVDEPFSYGSLRFKNRIGLSADSIKMRKHLMSWQILVSDFWKWGL